MHFTPYFSTKNALLVVNDERKVSPTKQCCTTDQERSFIMAPPLRDSLEINTMSTSVISKIKVARNRGSFQKILWAKKGKDCLQL